MAAPRGGRTALAGCLVAAGLAGCLLTAGLAAMVGAGGPARAAPGFAFTRLAGVDRYATAAALATRAFPHGASTVLVASGEQFPDALAGAFLAGNDHAPILLAGPAGPVPPSTLQALSALHASRVVILGGVSAVGSDVAAQLVAAHYAVDRIGGASRWDTMELLAEQPGTTVGTDAAGQRTAILATGENFPDALGAAPLAFARHLPVVLTDGYLSTLVPQARQTLEDLHIGHVVMVGGSAALSSGINQQLQSMGISVDQRQGADRSATSAALADEEISSWGFGDTGFLLARGDSFADALAGSPLAGSTLQPLLVTPGPGAPGAAGTFATQHSATEAGGLALGGDAALATSTLDAVAAAADVAPPSGPSGQPSGGSPGTTTTSPTSTGTSTGTPTGTSTGTPTGTSTGTPTGTSTGTPTGTSTGTSGPSPYPSQGTGYDISWPQCPGQSFPAGPLSVAVVGLNDGHAFSVNPCLPAEAAWAGSGLTFYLNLNSPGTGSASEWMSGPDGNCASTDTSCQSYNYGANAVSYSLQQAQAAGLSSSTWWLDVETGNNWSPSTAANAEVIAGAIHVLQAQGDNVGIYSTPYQWSQIAGSYRPTVPNWVPGSAANPAGWCGPSSFTDGVTWLVQYQTSAHPYDQDYAC